MGSQMDLVVFYGMMGDYMKDIIIKEKSKDLGDTVILMVKFMRVVGRMGYSMEMGY